MIMGGGGVKERLKNERKWEEGEPRGSRGTY